MEIPSRYEPQKTEEKIYQLWEKSGYFNPDNLPKTHKKPFTILMPPPNANGSLHMGHALFVSLQDVMIRYYRMKKRKALWIPGADHAGFETQVVYDKKLEKEGRDRFKISREQLYNEILSFTLTNKKVMEQQLRRLGASCDWSREKFTLDKNIIKVVYQTFEKLKKDELLYTGPRIINWCPKHQTSLSDLEIKHEERVNPLYYIKYGPIEVATVRPETVFGDVAIAVNPKDKRYKDFVGKEIKAPTLLGEIKIKVIADDIVDPKFGTGAVKVTPAHDPIDFEIWQRHKKEIPEPKQVIEKDGKLNDKTGIYSGLKVLEAREIVVKDMTEKGLLNPTKTDYNYKSKVAICYKCGSLIEPLILDNQWFIKMTEKPKNGKLSLRDLAVKAIKEKKIIFIPKKTEKIFLQWMKNLKDWNISRQIVWGIPIPGDKNNQVFDTWFSSGQWPFATLKTTKKGDFEKFYPTDVMETGWDILFFWVARMIMLGIYVTGKVPFRYIYLHGLVRDKYRQKMSKSKGNVIDPIEVASLYGADALRMALIVGNTPGRDCTIQEEKIIAYRNFATKIWNAARFVMMNTNDYKEPKKIVLSKREEKILKDFENKIKEIDGLMKNFKFYNASQKIYHYFWHTFCDKIIEKSKPSLSNPKTRKTAQFILLKILSDCLKILHPFMPFVTEEIYQMLPLKNKKKCLMAENWPT